MQIYVTATQGKPPWMQYGGKYTIVEKIFHRQLTSPHFNYQRGLPAFDEFLNQNGASENIKLSILRKGLYLKMNSDKYSMLCFIAKSELKKIQLDAFKVKIDIQEKLAGYLTLQIEQENIRCFVPAGNFSALNKFFRQKYFQKLYHLTIDPSPPVEQIKLVDIIAGFGKSKS